MPSLKRADELGTRAIAHGCTGMGNDQVRFDLAVKALGDYEIVAPIREIQKEHTRGPRVRTTVPGGTRLRRARKQKAYTINENLLGLTMSGRRDRPLGSAGRWRARLVQAKREQWPTRSRCA
jgi:argininosuccinate synthase